MLLTLDWLIIGYMISSLHLLPFIALVLQLRYLQRQQLPRPLPLLLPIPLELHNTPILLAFYLLLLYPTLY